MKQLSELALFVNLFPLVKVQAILVNTAESQKSLTNNFTPSNFTPQKQPQLRA